MEAIMSELTSSLLKDLIYKATQAVQFDAADEVKKLEDDLFMAQTLFDNLTTSETCQRWTGDVLRVCYDVEDLVADLLVDTSNRSMLQKTRMFFKKKTKTSTRPKIQEVRKSLKQIISKLKLVNETQQQEQHCVTVNKKVLFSERLVGREEEMEKIISLLLDDETNRPVNIVGIGGLGKTILAYNVQYDSRIIEKFQHFRWVPVSAKFDLKTVAESILRQRLECEYSSLVDTIEELFEQLYQGKSVLIVLDGLWDVTDQDWVLFRNLFLLTSGSKALVTTQNPGLASSNGANVYHLPLMSDEECQDLVIAKAQGFNNLSSREKLVLKDIAGEMAKKSKGLPLAASILGRCLSSNRTEDYWMTLSKRDIYDTREFKENIFPELKLNTADMGSHLKKCLAYCSLFPPNYDFKRDSLVQLWMAEGFILPQGTTSLKETGIEYFDDLYSRSFFQLSQIGEHEISCYRMHEFIHWFAKLVASDAFYPLEEISCFPANWHKKVRHLSLLCTGIQLHLKEIEKCHGLRTFLLPSERGVRVGQIPYSVFQKLGRLRVLDLSHTDVDELPDSLGRLKLLRYLDLSETQIQWLPESISKLGLQVLKLKGCEKLLELPKNLNTLTSLIHLDVDIQRLPSKPPSIGCLSNLQTLPIFSVGTEEGYRITELKNLKFLRDIIKLVDLENVKDGAEAQEAKLCEKTSIRRLELEWSSDSTDRSIAMDVFSNLQPQINLKSLEVTRYVGSGFPTWLTSQSCRLVSIHLQNCSPEDVLSPFGQLPCLETLHIEGMHCVKHISYSLCGDGGGGALFPLLKSLKIQDMANLTEWHKLPDNCMLKLNNLTFMNCPSLSSVQSLNLLTSLQNLEIDLCSALEALPELPTSIQSLIISKSDIMKRRCKPEDPVWHIIESIPRVEIDYIRIGFP